MRPEFTNSVIPTSSNSGDVPDGGMLSKRGQKKVEGTNNKPQISVLNPVRLPAFIPGVLSGEIKIGGPEKYPLIIVLIPHIMNNQLPRGMVPSALVKRPKSLILLAIPLNVIIYKKLKLSSSSMTD
mmetsp:Transcript_55/g.98  ORF Transcript_55/g.98 Transcript_55/m.98 type:complete len:126 (+) Transcript_55:473-850(+)